MQVYLEFEKPIAEMEGKIAELRAISKDDPEVNILKEVTRLEEKVAPSWRKHIRASTHGRRRLLPVILRVRIL